MPDDVTKSAEENPEETPGKAPEFEGDFDAEKASRLVANLRSEVATLKERNTALSAERDEFKSAAEKTGAEREEALSAALKRAEDAERALAIKEHNLPDDVVEEFADYLTGTPEEVNAKAAKLAARLTPKAETTDEPGDEQKPDENPDDGEKPTGRPAPALTPGHGGVSREPFDAKALADEIRANA